MTTPRIFQIGKFRSGPAMALCERDRKNYTQPLDAVVVVISGGFGNHFIQIITALAFSLVMKITVIYVMRRFLWIGSNNLTTVHGVHVVPVKYFHSLQVPRERLVRMGWWAIDIWCADFSYSYLTTEIRESLLRLLPPVKTDPEMIFLYLRGGDIWNNKFIVHRKYAQPPCRFYLDPMHNFTKAYVIGGTFNPCTDLLIKAGPQSEPYRGTWAMSRMVYSRHIVLAASSRSHAVLALSPFPKRFWVFDQQTEWTRLPMWWRGYSPLQFGEGLNCVPSDQFRAAVFIWRASFGQIQFILNSSCRWEPVPHGPSFQWISNGRISPDEPI
jgi:hypothetical protein